MNQQEHIELFQGLQVNKVEINDEDRLENYCATAEKYRDDDEGNQAEIEHKHGSKNYCVNAEKYRDEDESNSAKINAENRVVEGAAVTTATVGAAAARNPSASGSAGRASNQGG